MAGRKDRIAQLEEELATLRELNAALAEVLRRCPPRSVAVGRQRDLVLGLAADLNHLRLIVDHKVMT